MKQALIQRFLQSSRESIALTQRFDITNLKYEIVKNLTGGIEALTNGTADYFQSVISKKKRTLKNGWQSRNGIEKKHFKKIN